jgi:small-conductance mechanosensitive channel
MTTNMFKVGDWVQFGDKFGRVKEITFFNTKFRSPQGEQHIIPNENITAQDVTNISRGRYRNDLLISIDYDSNIDSVIQICDKELQQMTAPDSDTLIDAYDPTSVKEFGDSGIILSVKVWLNNPSPALLNQTQTTVFNRLHTRFNEEDISIPFPQRVISERGDIETGPNTSQQESDE